MLARPALACYVTPMDVKEIDILGDHIATHWYYRHKARVLERCLRSRPYTTVLDVGAGSGFFTRHLLNAGRAERGVCVDPGYLENRNEMENGKPLDFCRSGEGISADLVLLMDVLEHVDDDVSLLTPYVQHAPSNAEFIISVPAFSFLWSGHDVFLEHRRRYTLKQIEAVAHQSGLIVERGFYAFAPVFPIAATLRLLENKTVSAQSQLKRHHPLINAGLAALCALETPFVRTNTIAGLSAFCCARKA